jgi:hypothetical protein
MLHENKEKHHACAGAAKDEVIKLNFLVAAVWQF